MANPVAVTLTAEQQSMLDEIARHRGEPTDKLVGDAVREWLQYEIEFRKAVDEGLADVAAGRLYEVEEVKAHFEAKFAARRNDAAE